MAPEISAADLINFEDRESCHGLYKLTGKPLGSLDQCIESVHQYFDQRMNSSKYKVKEKSSDVAGDKLLKLVLHFNAYNLFN